MPRSRLWLHCSKASPQSGDFTNLSLWFFRPIIPLRRPRVSRNSEMAMAAGARASSTAQPRGPQHAKRLANAGHAYEAHVRCTYSRARSKLARRPACFGAEDGPEDHATQDHPAQARPASELARSMFSGRPSSSRKRSHILGALPATSQALVCEAAREGPPTHGNGQERQARGASAWEVGGGVVQRTDTADGPGPARLREAPIAGGGHELGTSLQSKERRLRRTSSF